MYGLMIFLATLLVASTQAISYEQLIQEQWEQFKLEHGKFYVSETEEEYRKDIFMGNLHKVNEHNKLYEQDLSSYKMAMNQFGDQTEDEFMRFYTVDMPELPQYENLSDYSSRIDWHQFPQAEDNFVIFAPPSDVEEKDLPKNVDWRSKGAVTNVKNQGQCGSCWSFSATGALEAQWFLKKTHKLVALSEQQLVDCSWKYGNQGCNGGWMHWAFRYIKDNGGIDTESSYPYQARNGVCSYKSQNKAATVSQVVRIPPGENNLLQKVSSVGPISIAAEVSFGFSFYHSGVYDEPRCGTKMNHAMLVVGYGNEGGKDYWLVKNSWGPNWGDKGYIKMARNKNNQCGISNAASYPIV